MAFPISPDFTQIPNSPKGSITYIQWTGGPNYDRSNKSIWLNCRIWYYDAQGNLINDPDPNFPSGWERAIVASNKRMVNFNNNATVVYPLTAEQNPETLVWTYSYLEDNGSTVNVSVNNPDGRPLYIDNKNAIIEQSSVMGQFDYFDNIAKNQSIILYPFISQVILSEADNYPTFITRI